MVAIKVLSILAIVGAVAAAPANGQSDVVARDWQDKKYNSNWGTKPTPTEPKEPSVVVEEENVFVTEYVTVTGSKPQSPPTQAPAAPAPQKSSPAPAAPSSPAPSEPEAPADSGYMGIVNQYRAAMGLPNLSIDSKLQSNAQNTADSSGGKLTHKLNPGTMGQVLAPGEDTLEKFEHVFVGGWLCEIPSLLPSDTCSEFTQGWDHAGQTGHAKILTDTKYSKIGCACGSNVWACDLA